MNYFKKKSKVHQKKAKKISCNFFFTVRSHDLKRKIKKYKFFLDNIR